PELPGRFRGEDFLIGLAVECLPWGAEGVRGGVVGIQIPPLQVLDPRQAGQMVHKACEALFALLQPLCPLTQVVLGPLRVRAVPQDLGEAATRPTPVPQRGQDAAGPEAAAVLADVPAVVLPSARLQRLLPLLLRHAGVDVLRGVEPIRRLTDDLTLGIA